MIGRDLIDSVRTRTDLVALIRETVKLQQRGRSFTGLCPFHQEKSPSFSVNPERGLFYCFGCKASGDCFKYVELTEGLSFGEALRRLAERAGVELVDDRSDRDRGEEARARKAKDDLYSLNQIAAGFFEKMLVEHPHAQHARDELTKRGLLFEGPMGDVLRSFRVGYAPHGWDALATYLRQQGASPAQAETLGLLSTRTSGSGYYDAFRHRLMVAILDVQGRVVAFSGRALPSVEPDPKEAERGPPPKYVNSKESSIYAKGSTLFGLHQARNAIRTRGDCVLVEGNFDLIAMHARGIQNVVAPMGTAFTEDQARLLRRFTQSVTLLFDGDTAGRKALWASRPTCKLATLSVRATRMPQGKDPDEFLRNHKVEEMHALLKAARSLDELLIDDLCERVGVGSDLEAKRGALEKLRPLVEEQPIDLRSVLARRIAERLGLDGATMWRSMRSAQSTEAAPNRAREERDDERMSRAIVEALLTAPDLLDDEEVAASLSRVTGDWAFAVLALRRERQAARAEGREIDGNAIVAELASPVREAVAGKLVTPTLNPTRRSNDPDAGEGEADAAVSPEQADDPVQEARRVIITTTLKLDKALALDRTREIQREIERAEATGDFTAASNLAGEKAMLTARLRATEAAIRRGDGT